MGIKGNLGDVSLPDVFQIISIGKRSGKLVLKSMGGKANVVFDAGRIVQASIDNYAKNIGKILMEKRFLSEEKLLEAIELQRTLPQWRQLGTICIDSGFITKEQLEEGVKALITEIIMILLTWKEGGFSFDSHDPKIDDDISLDMRELIVRSGVSSDFAILEGARLLDERAEEVRELKPKEGKEIPKNESLTDFAKGILEDIDLSFLDVIPHTGKAKGRSSLPSTIRGVAKIYSEIRILKDLLDRSDRSLLTQEFSFAVMKFASEIVDRVILFDVEDGFALGIAHMGLVQENLSLDEEVRSLKIPLDKPSALSRAYESKETYCGEFENTPWNDFIISKIGDREPPEAAALPVIVNGEVRSILYADNYFSREAIKNLDELEAFIYQAGMALEISLLKKGI